MSYDAHSLSDPGRVIRRIEDILKDLDERQGPFESAVADLAKREAHWELKLQRALIRADGSSDAKRKANALDKTVIDSPQDWELMVAKQAEVKATRAVVGLLEAQLSALQSVLRAQTREQWSTSAAQPAMGRSGR